MRSTIVFAMVAAGGMIAAGSATAASVSRSFAVTAEVPCSFTVPKMSLRPVSIACNGAEGKSASPIAVWTRDRQSGGYFLTIEF